MTSVQKYKNIDEVNIMSQDKAWGKIVAKFELREKIKDLQKDWQKKCKHALAGLCLKDVKNCYYYELEEEVCEFLKTLYKNVESEHNPDDNEKIIERHTDFSSNRYDGAVASFVCGDYFLDLVGKYNLENEYSETLGELKKIFGKKLGRSRFNITTKLRNKNWENLAKLDYELWKNILATAKIDTNKAFDDLSEQEIFKIISLHGDIFGLHNNYKRFVLYPKFWNEIHTKDPKLSNLEKTTGIEIPKQKDQFCYYSKNQYKLLVHNSYHPYNDVSEPQTRNIRTKVCICPLIPDYDRHLCCTS